MVWPGKPVTEATAPTTMVLWTQFFVCQVLWCTLVNGKNGRGRQTEKSSNELLSTVLLLHVHPIVCNVEMSQVNVDIGQLGRVASFLLGDTQTTINHYIQLINRENRKGVHIIPLCQTFQLQRSLLLSLILYAQGNH